MTFKQVRDTLSGPLEWASRQIGARPKGALVVWVVSAVVAFVFGAWVG
jgi:hypothetical protein